MCKEFYKDDHSLIQVVLEMCIENPVVLCFGNDGKVFLVRRMGKIAHLRKKGEKFSRGGIEDLQCLHDLQYSYLFIFKILTNMLLMEGC